MATIPITNAQGSVVRRRQWYEPAVFDQNHAAVVAFGGVEGLFLESEPWVIF
jgi:hypothetical protein